MAWLFGALLAVWPAASFARVLVPMDAGQADHLRAYGLVYWALERGVHGEWLLNYRGGAFLLPDLAALPEEALIRGVTIEMVNDADVAKIQAEIADNNMETIKLETAPRVAVYVPPSAGVVAKRADSISVRKSTGSSEVVKGMELLDEDPQPAVAGATGTPVSPASNKRAFVAPAAVVAHCPARLALRVSTTRTGFVAV